MKTAPVKTETVVALASLALQSDKKLFQKANLENKHLTLSLSGADIRARSVGIDSYMYWGLYRFFWEISSDNETYHSVLGSDGVYRDSYVHSSIPKHNT